MVKKKFKPKLSGPAIALIVGVIILAGVIVSATSGQSNSYV